MHSPLPAASPSNPAILIAAISGRALAAAARRAGYRPLVADLFGDSDTLALAERAIRLPGSLYDGIDGTRIVDSLTELAGGERPVALVYGSGFERRPEVLDTVAQAFPLAGNGAETVRAIKDPQRLAELCFRLSIPHPEIRLWAPETPEGWLFKLAGGAGGGHVIPAGSGAAREGGYFQRHVAGRSLSALFIAAGGRAHVVGFSRQWAAPAPTSPHRYGGAVRLVRLDRNRRRRIETWLDALAGSAGLVGLCSADFIDGPAGLHLLEINPRPGATLDIFDGEAAPLLVQHLRAVNGAAIVLPRYGETTAAAVAYADQAIGAFPAIAWPPLTADHQQPGTRLAAGDPVCTVIARAGSAVAAERAVKHRIRQLATHWREDDR